MEQYIDIIMKQIVSIIVGGLCTYLAAQLKMKQAELKEKEKSARLGRQADRVILRNIIRQACKKSIKKGWVPLDEKSDILACYDTYEEIIKQEGITNGVIDDIIREYRMLPNAEPLPKE